MMIAFGDIFGIGGSSLISRLFGEKETRKQNVSVHFGVLMSLMVADIGTAVMAAIIILKIIKNIENKNKM